VNEFSQVIDMEVLSEFEGFLDGFDALDSAEEIFRPTTPLAERPRRIAITHPRLGIYIGSSCGTRLWSLNAPDWCPPLAVTFSDEDDARDFVAAGTTENDPDEYGYISVPTSDEEYLEHFAGREELAFAGLEPLFGPVFEIEGLARTQ